MNSMDRARWRALLVVLPLSSLMAIFGGIVTGLAQTSVVGETTAFVVVGLLFGLQALALSMQPSWLRTISAAYILSLAVMLVVRLALSYQNPYYQEPSNSAFAGVTPYIPLCYVMAFALVDTRKALWYSIGLWVAVAALTLEFALPQTVVNAGRHGLFNLLLFVFIAQPIGIFMLSQMRGYVDELVEELSAAIGDSAEVVPEGADQDPVTEMYNQDHFQRVTERSIAAAVEERREVGLILVDVDKLKRYNDTMGYSAGDTLLRRIGKIVTARAPVSSIFIARMGGGQFAVLCDLMSKAETLATAERIRHGVAKADYSFASEGYSVSVSVGVCFVDAEPNTSFDTLIVCAERALYNAQRAGGNLVIA